ncbi:MAG TPA: hypothetical protein VHZ03_45275 [Trebonia sp.]|jgi:hypothetical protein|nr:hypothetical protein [Trebonia sp.]
MVSPFGDFLQVDIDPLPEPNMPPMDRSQFKSLQPLARATVAVVPIMLIEAQHGAVRRMLARMRERGVAWVTRRRRRSGLDAGRW